MKKQYVIPTSEVREISLNSCIMSGNQIPNASGPSNPEAMPAPARRLYA